MRHLSHALLEVKERGLVLMLVGHDTTMMGARLEKLAHAALGQERDRLQLGHQLHRRVSSAYCRERSITDRYLESRTHPVESPALCFGGVGVIVVKLLALYAAAAAHGCGWVGCVDALLAGRLADLNE
jgi:hypothetical protein